MDLVLRCPLGDNDFGRVAEGGRCVERDKEGGVARGSPPERLSVGSRRENSLLPWPSFGPLPPVRLALSIGRSPRIVQEDGSIDEEVVMCGAWVSSAHHSRCSGAGSFGQALEKPPWRRLQDRQAIVWTVSRRWFPCLPEYPCVCDWR